MNNAKFLSMLFLLASLTTLLFTGDSGCKSNPSNLTRYHERCVSRYLGSNEEGQKDKLPLELQLGVFSYLFGAPYQGNFLSKGRGDSRSVEQYLETCLRMYESSNTPRLEYRVFRYPLFHAVINRTGMERRKDLLKNINMGANLESKDSFTLDNSQKDTIYKTINKKIECLSRGDHMHTQSEISELKSTADVLEKFGAKTN